MHARTLFRKESKLREKTPSILQTPLKRDPFTVVNHFGFPHFLALWPLKIIIALQTWTQMLSNVGNLQVFRITSLSSRA